MIQRASTDFIELNRIHQENTAPLRSRLQEVNLALRNPANIDANCGFQLLWERIQLEDAIKMLETEHELKFTKLRYRKGIELVKMLYEKILSMDHHFSSLKAQQELLKISNPHNYPEFKESLGATEEKMKRKFNFSVPTLLQGNPFLSATFSIVGFTENTKTFWPIECKNVWLFTCVSTQPVFCIHVTKNQISICWLIERIISCPSFIRNFTAVQN